MPSPFPGMDPFIERLRWRDFHHRFIAAAAEALAPQLRPSYVALIEEDLYVTEAGEELGSAGRADVLISANPAREVVSERSGVGLLEAPTRVRLPLQETERQGYIEIRDRASWEVVAVVELLSATNKRPGAGRDQYLAKRRRLLAGPGHFVEIDLLRIGQPLPAEGRPDCVYSVMVSRAEERPRAEFWPIGLREPLPVVPVPVRAPHPDAALVLQELLARVYDAADYSLYLYDEPPEPRLGPEDAAWAEAVLSRR